MASISPDQPFTLIKRGYVHHTVWTFWFSHGGGNFYGLLSGSGTSAGCIRGGAGGNSTGADLLTVAQFPGRPVVFLYGYLDGCFKCSSITAIRLSVFNKTVAAAIRPFGTSGAFTVMAEISNLPCASYYVRQRDYPYSYAEMAGRQNVGGGGGGGNHSAGAEACVEKALGSA